MKAKYGKLRWWNLRDNKCPQCGTDFFNHKTKHMIDPKKLFCPCGFEIGLERMAEIINGMNKQDVGQKLDLMEMERYGN